MFNLSSVNVNHELKKYISKYVDEMKLVLPTRIKVLQTINSTESDPNVKSSTLLIEGTSP